MICLDTGAVIAAVQENLDHPDRLNQRKRIIPYLARQKGSGRLLIPSVVVGEYFYGLPEETWLDETAKLMSSDFFIGAYDAIAAFQAARVRRRLLGQMAEKEAIKNHGGNKNKFRADVQIIATALVNNTTLLLTADRPLLQAARQVGLNAIHIDDLPLPAATGLLPFDDPAG